MAKYNLSYYYKNKLVKVDLSKLNVFDGKDINSLEVIDKFTTVFNSENELLTYLIGKGILNHKPMHIYITKTKKNKETKEDEEYIIYKGEKILFNDSKDMLNISYIESFIEENKKNKYFMSIISKNYLNKYTKDGEPVSKHITGLFKTLLDLSREIDNIGYMNLEIDDRVKYDEYIREFIELEFFKTLKEGRKINYRNIHNFIEFIKYEEDFQFENELNESEENVISKPIEKDEETVERDIEEFIENDDLKNDSILENYRKPICDPEIDGKNVYRPLYKEELRDSYEEYFKKRR